MSSLIEKEIRDFLAYNTSAGKSLLLEKMKYESPARPHKHAKLYASSSHSFAPHVSFLAPEVANMAQDLVI